MKNNVTNEQEIRVFGNPDKSELGFPDRSDIERYISHEIFESEDGRYRYTSSKNADIIVLSREGLAFGHFEIADKVKPNEADRKAYPRVQYVYLVEKSSLYKTPVRLSDMSIKLGQWGKRISEEQFAELQQLAGGLTECVGVTKLPNSTIELERILREVKQRLGQSEFRATLIAAYNGRCAVTDCDAVDALEAAHIIPHCNIESNEPCNGLLLRSDIHTLFDRHLVGIHPTSKKVHVAPKLKGTDYGTLNGKTLAVPDDIGARPLEAALEERWCNYEQATGTKHA